MEVLIVASSSTDSGIGCWDLRTGKEQLRYKSCASPAQGLTAVGDRFLAASQLRNASASSGSIFYWSWTKPQVEVKSFPVEAIKPLAANSGGTYIVGGGSSGDLYLWEVATGTLLKKWHGHYRSVTCLTFSEDDSLLVSGSQDGSVRIWSLLRLFDDSYRQQGSHLYEHSFNEHTMPVTDVVMDYGGCNAIIVSASEDRTCKVWSLSKGMLLRNIVFPSTINALALDPGGTLFYAGGKDGKIYIGALNAKSDFGTHTLGSVSEQSKAVTCLAYCAEGNLLLSGSEDGMVHVWDPKTCDVIRAFSHGKGPLTNVQIVRRPLVTNPFSSNKMQSSWRRHGSSLPPPLEKYESSREEVTDDTVMVDLPACDDLVSTTYLSSYTINNQVKELQQQGSAATEIEMERLKSEFKRSSQMINQWQTMYENLHQFCVTELLGEQQIETLN